MKISKKILIAAVLIGLITVFALNYYIKSQPTSVQTQVSYSKVVVAANIIPANVKITADMVALKSLPSESVLPESFSTVDKVIGKTSNSEILKGEQVLSGRVVIDSSKAALAYRVPENMRAISIPASETASVAGFINTGDRIDILATYNKKDINSVSTTYTQFQNIEVAAVGSIASASSDKRTALPSSLTLLVSPSQAEVLVYAVSNGSLYLTLRNPVDKGKANLDHYNSDNFSTYKAR